MSQQDEFQERLNRIRSQQRTGGSRGPGAASRPRPARREIAGNALYPLSLAGAFLLGILAVGLGRYIRFHLADGAAGDQTTDLDLLITAGLGMATAFVLAQMFRLTSKEHLTLQSAGIFAAICTFHNLFHWLPGPMSAVFSPGYVTEMQQMTPANTAIFRGFVLSLTDTGAVTQGVAADPPATDAEPRLLLLDRDK